MHNALCIADFLHSFDSAMTLDMSSLNIKWVGPYVNKAIRMIRNNSSNIFIRT